jgi:hypothetical protein
MGEKHWLMAAVMAKIIYSLWDNLHTNADLWWFSFIEILTGIQFIAFYKMQNNLSVHQKPPQQGG